MNLNYLTYSRLCESRINILVTDDEIQTLTYLKKQQPKLITFRGSAHHKTNYNNLISKECLDCPLCLMTFDTSVPFRLLRETLKIQQKNLNTAPVIFIQQNAPKVCKEQDLKDIQVFELVCGDLIQMAYKLDRGRF